MFVFGFKKNGFTVPFLGLKPFQMAYVCGGRESYLPAFPSPRAPLSFARVLREHVIVCITLIGEGGRAAAPPAEAGWATLRRLFRSIGCGCPSGCTLHRPPQRIATRPPWSLSPPAMFGVLPVTP